MKKKNKKKNQTEVVEYYSKKEKFVIVKMQCPNPECCKNLEIKVIL